MKTYNTHYNNKEYLFYLSIGIGKGNMKRKEVKINLCFFILLLSIPCSSKTLTNTVVSQQQE